MCFESARAKEKKVTADEVKFIRKKLQKYSSKQLSTSTSTSATASTLRACPPASRGSTSSSSEKTPKVCILSLSLSLLQNSSPSKIILPFLLLLLDRRILRPRARGRPGRRGIPQSHHARQVPPDRRVRLRDGLPQQPQKGASFLFLLLLLLLFSFLFFSLSPFLDCPLSLTLIFSLSF